jgi:aspartyl-tRNA(Asn)/glutamyl-tRNA(Gln) amidotransferase subunit A
MIAPGSIKQGRRTNEMSDTATARHPTSDEALRERVAQAGVTLETGVLGQAISIYEQGMTALRSLDKRLAQTGGAVVPGPATRPPARTAGQHANPPTVETDDRNEPLTLQSLSGQAALIQRRQLSPVELVEAHLDEIERLDGLLHAYLTVAADEALAGARRAEAEINRGRWRGPLHGVPIGLKDLFETAGIRTTAGSRILVGNVPEQDAAAVRKLREAGAVVLGKQSTFEFACGMPYEDDYFAPPRNPWNLDRSPSGSSSGSAVALAAGLCSGALGTCTGGSVRSPAAYTGVVGFKPSYGLISRSGVIPLSWTLDHVGPMARTVRDVALLLDAVAGFDPADPASVEFSAGGYAGALDGPVAGLRVGVPRSLIESNQGIEPDVLTAFNAALGVLAGLGMEIVDVALPDIEHLGGTRYIVMLCEAAAYHGPWLRSRFAEYGTGFREIIPAGLMFTAADYIQARRGLGLYWHAFQDLMQSVDLLATPTLPDTAKPYGRPRGPRGAMAPFTQIFNVTHQPSITVPCGFDREALPVGLLLSGRVFEDELVLRAADAYQRATPWHERRPPLAAPAANGQGLHTSMKAGEDILS